MNPSLSQSINPSMNQSLNQSVNQSRIKHDSENGSGENKDVELERMHRELKNKYHNMSQDYKWVFEIMPKIR